MIIPVGHSQETVRRLPWVTFGIMALCLVALVATNHGTGGEERAAEALEEALDYYFQHPYLDLDPRLEEMLFGEVPEEEWAALKDAFFPDVGRPENPGDVADLQARLDELCSAAVEAVDETPYRRYGLVPGRQSALAWVTHLFMHAGWMHLLGNLLILYLAGPFIEDVWGRPVYVAFYLVAGWFASLAFVIKNPDSMIPLIGASGAISAVMGAFLIRYWSTNIRFFYMFGLVFRGTFDAPAWLMLPIWFCMQVFFALLTDGLPGGGVAYWAHIGGFVFGAGVAFAFKRLEVEERWLAPAIAGKTTETVIENRALDEALQAQAAGSHEQAYEMLAQECRRNRGNVDAALAFWQSAVEMGRAEEAAPAMMAAIRNLLRSGQEEMAIEHWTDVRSLAPSTRAGIDVLVRLARALHRRGEPREAASVLRLAMLEGGGGMTGPAALRIASAAREIDRRVAQAALQIALGNPELDPSERAQAVELMESLRRPAVDPGLPFDSESNTA